MLLENRTAIVHGGSGSVGSAVARAFARQGADVHLTGRTWTTLEDIATGIRGAGGVAHVDVLDVLDVLDRDAVERHAAAVTDHSDGIDICFNATFSDDIQDGRSRARAARWHRPGSGCPCGDRSRPDR